MTALEIKGLRKQFGGVLATDDVSLTVESRELLSLIGPNGAGKTTLLKQITGAISPDRGRVLLHGEDVTRISTHLRARKGLIMTHQIVRPFRDLTLLENVMAVVAHDLFSNPLRALMSRPGPDDRARALTLIERVGIADVADKRADEVPLGFLKRLQIARALAAQPQVLMLDEPLAGLNHGEAERIADLITQLNQEGLTIVLIEHNLGEVLRISHRLAVLNNGALLAEGEPQAVMQRADVRAAYLGTKSEAA